ncbi:Transposase [Shigella dysenteriae 1617]|uniref:Transposase n=1 Tax=Shigella dysenteriae 1617 TaxID=754093 RepID=A0A0A6ZYW4_SHIDY|nr:Transposase [Shigella dysenteriae 1617]
MAVTAAKSVMAFRVLTMAVDLCRLTTRTMNVNAGHERTSKARIIHQIQLIRGITRLFSGNDSNLLIVFYVQIMPDDFVMQLHRF